MPQTALGFRYPASTDAPNVPLDIQRLADDLNAVGLYLEAAGITRTAHILRVNGDIYAGYGTSGQVRLIGGASATPQVLLGLAGLAGWYEEGGRLKAVATGIEPWTAPSLVNGWVASGTSPVGYYRDPFGIVRLRGQIAGPSSAPAMFTLPAGYRPANTASVWACASTAGATKNVVVDSAGVVGLQTAVGDFAINLDAITFRAA